MHFSVLLLVTNFELMLMAYSGSATRIPAPVPHRMESETKRWDEHLRKLLNRGTLVNAFRIRESNITAFNCKLTYRDCSLRQFVGITWWLYSHHLALIDE